MSRSFRYGPWDDGPDPLAPPFDLRGALDELGQDVLSGSSVRDALRDLLRRGRDGMRGLDQWRNRVRRQRSRLRDRGDLAGALAKARQLLDQALSYERDELARDPGPDARMAEMELATVPDEVSRAVQALRSYEWTSPEAREAYDQIRQMLRSDVVDAHFEGMRQALSSPEATEAMREMLADLNTLLAAHARGEDTTEAFREFMAKHGSHFPENPRDVDELIDALARRAAAAERMMRSLSPEQREELGRLMNEAFSGTGLGSQLNALHSNLRALRPNLDWTSSARVSGDEPLDFADAVSAVSELADLEALSEQLGQDYPGATLDDIDVDALERQFGQDAVRDLRQLRELERELERQGYLSRDRDGLHLTPKSLRRLGEVVLRQIFRTLESDRDGSHNAHRTGAADEPTGASRLWRFGDEQPIDPVRTVRNAVVRGGRAGPGPVSLSVEDFEIVETERRTTAAVALCVDLSYSMIQEDRWGPMKQTALALSHLISTRFRQDALEIIGFNLHARRLSPVQLAGVEPEWVQGTNLQHALMLASRHVRRHPDAEPVVLVVTDGEPTAHLQSDGTATFNWPTVPETVQATVQEVDALTRYGATLNFFMLGEDPGLARFVDAVARRNGGRVFTPDLERLGEFVVADYLRTRGGRSPRQGRPGAA